MRPALLTGFVAIAASIATATETEPVHNIEITADVPTVQVSPRRAGRISMRLPSLTFALNVTVLCDKNWQPDSMSVSVADSMTSFNAEQLQASRELGLELRIPSNQISPLRVEQFCIAGGSDDPDKINRNKITIPGVVSAQASLRCATESTKSIIYVTEPLDVVLECVVPDPADN